MYRIDAFVRCTLLPQQELVIPIAISKRCLKVYSLRTYFVIRRRVKRDHLWVGCGHVLLDKLVRCNCLEIWVDGETNAHYEGLECAAGVIQRM